MLALLIASLVATSTLEAPKGALAREISTRLTAEVERRLALGAGSQVSITRLDTAEPRALAKGRLLEVELSTKGRPLGWVTARARILVDQKEREVWFRAEVVALAPTLVAGRSIDRGETLSASDLKLVMLPVTEDRVDSVEQIAGSLARWPIAQGEAISRRGVERPMVVTRGTTILAVIEQPGFVLKAPAEAMDNGAIGDEIQLRLGASKKVVRGVVLGRDEVEVRR